MIILRWLRSLSWQSIGFCIFAVALTGTVLLYRLTSIVRRLSPAELAFIAKNAHLHSLLADQQNIPYRILLYSATVVHLNARTPSIILSVISLAVVVYILRNWYGPRTMVLGFIIVASSAWFIHVARFVSIDIEYFVAVTALLGAHAALNSNDKNRAVFYIWIVIHGLVLFIPGLFWFVAINVLLQRYALRTAWTNMNRIRDRIIVAVVTLCLVATWAYSVTRKLQTARVWFGLPSSLNAWHILLRRLADVVLFLVYRGPYNPALWLGRLPLLDAFLIFMLLAGSFFYARHWRANRTHLLASFLAIGATLYAFGGVPLTIIAPVVFILIIAGTAYVLYTWLGVFPRNPLARSIGILIVSGAVLLSAAYNLQQYFIAWPKNQDTVALYDSPIHMRSHR